jgi:hypothetical protein
MERILLKDAVTALRQDLIESIAAAQGENLKFEVGEIIMEFQIEIEQSVSGNGNIKCWVVEMGTESVGKDKSVHKVTIPLKPVRSDGQPVLTGSNKQSVE